MRVDIIAFCLANQTKAGLKVEELKPLVSLRRLTEGAASSPSARKIILIQVSCRATVESKNQKTELEMSTTGSI